MASTASLSKDTTNLSNLVDTKEFWRRFPDALKSVNIQFFFGADAQADRPKKTRRVLDEQSSSASTEPQAQLHIGAFNCSKLAPQQLITASAITAPAHPSPLALYPYSDMNSAPPNILGADARSGEGELDCSAQPVAQGYAPGSEGVYPGHGPLEAWEQETQGADQEQGRGWKEGINSFLHGSPCIPEPGLEVLPGMAALSDSELENNSPLFGNAEGAVESSSRPGPLEAAATVCGGQGGGPRELQVTGGILVSSLKEEESWLQALEFLQDDGAPVCGLQGQGPSFAAIQNGTAQQAGESATLPAPLEEQTMAVGLPVRAVSPGLSTEYFNADEWLLQGDTWQFTEDCPAAGGLESEHASVSTIQEGATLPSDASVSAAASEEKDPFIRSWKVLTSSPLPSSTSTSAVAEEEDVQKSIVPSQKRCHEKTGNKRLTISDSFQRPPDLTARLANIVHGKAGGQWLPTGSLHLAADMQYGIAPDAVGGRPPKLGRLTPFQSQIKQALGVQSPRMMPPANCEGQLSSTPEEMRSRLLAYAEALATDDTLRARILQGRLHAEANLEGNHMQRVAAYFLQGLQTRGAGNIVEQYRSCGLLTQEQVCDAIYEYSTRLPLYHSTIKGSVYTIADALMGSKKVHIIDFSVWQGGQWKPLFRRLGMLPGEKPRVRITVLNLGCHPMQPGCRRAYYCNEAEIRAALEPCAAEFGITLELEKIDMSVESLAPGALRLRDDEVRAVCCGFRLQYVSDQAAGGGRMSRRNYLLECIRQLNPRVVTIADMEADLNVDFYLQRLTRALDFYSAHFQAIERGYEDGNEGSARARAVYEEFFLGKDLVNAVAGEGTLRVHRPETAARTAARMRALGFWRHPLSADVGPMVRGFMPRFACGWTLEEGPGQLRMLWMGRPLASVTIWRSGRHEDEGGLLGPGGVPLPLVAAGECPCAICAQQRQAALVYV